MFHVKHPIGRTGRDRSHLLCFTLNTLDSTERAFPFDGTAVLFHVKHRQLVRTAFKLKADVACEAFAIGSFSEHRKIRGLA